MAGFPSLYTPPFDHPHSLPVELMHVAITPAGPSTKLPGVASLVLPPLTPPDDVPMHTVAHELNEAPLSRSITPPAQIDFLSNPTSNTSQFFAEKTCEMICYMWFSPPKKSSPSPVETTAYPSPTHSPVQSQDLFKGPSSSWSLRLNPTPTFVQFMQKLLETTQVSQSVIVLSLHYIYRLKTSAQGFGAAQPGSEFRVAVVALMMANKFLDDNTYTNQTWSSISSIPLSEINKMELEFLDAAGWNLYVAHTDYKSWQKMLMGLVNARETERWTRKRAGETSRREIAAPHPRGRKIAPVVIRPSSHSQPRHRSTSPPLPSSSSLHPSQFVPRSANRNSWNHSNPYPTPPYSYPTSSSSQDFTQLQYELGTKRPSSPDLDSRPSKRLSLQIPTWTYNGGSSSANPSPLEGFAHNFGRMTIASGANSAGPSPRLFHNNQASPYQPEPSFHNHSQVLVRPHAVPSPQRNQVPENLYFYTLHCHSPSEGAKGKKGRLLYQPTMQSIDSHGRRNVHPTVTGTVPPTSGSSYQYTPPQPSTCRLPPISTFHSAASSRGTSPSLPASHGCYGSSPMRTPERHSLYAPHPSSLDPHHYPQYPHHWQNRPVEVGAFANNGPPGVWRTF